MEEKEKRWQVRVELKPEQQLPDGGWWYTDLTTNQKVVSFTKHVTYYLDNINESTKIIGADQYMEKRITQAVWRKTKENI